MSYSVIGMLAIAINLIINRDVLWRKDDFDLIPAYKEYRAFIVSILVFCTSDVLWGLLDEYHIQPFLYLVTVIYFASMMTGFMLWTRYIAAYMQGGKILKNILTVTSTTMLVAELIILIINFFIPIQFWFDENAVYHAGIARYVPLTLQLILFAVTSMYTFMKPSKDPDATKRLKSTVGYFGLVMAALIVLQLFYPLLPLYSIGYLVGSCLTHTFVVEGEKEDYRKTLEETLRREKQHKEELGSAKRKIYTDPLTGTGSKQAYMDDVDRLNQKIKSGDSREFAIAVFDLNNLKEINDTKGHDFGDIYIYNAGMLIGEYFPHSPVYRIGGDEFAAIIGGEDYKIHEELMEKFNERIDNNKKSDKVVVASGIARYQPEIDKNYVSVFERADRRMYIRKKELKA